MTSPTLSKPQLQRLRRKAKQLARAQGIPLNAAQQHLSSELGYRNWSQLARRVEPEVETFGQRHYLHGDQVEGVPGRFFCARCDRYEDDVHFYSDFHADQRDISYLAQSLGRWEQSRSWRKHLRRPDGAPNWFTDAMAVKLRTGDPAESLFFRWLRMQTLRIDEVGAFAVDAVGDEGFNRLAQTVEKMKAHIAFNAFSYKPSAPAACARAVKEFCLLTRSTLA